MTTLDAKGRPATSKAANFETTTYAYTGSGRLDLLTTGTGANARTTDFSYYTSGPSAGFLQSVTDAEGRTVSYEYDLAGRVSRQTLPDSRVIEYGYDAAGNLTSLTPPGRDAHVFRRGHQAGRCEASVDETDPSKAQPIRDSVVKPAQPLQRRCTVLALNGTTVKTEFADYPCATREAAEALYMSLRSRAESRGDDPGVTGKPQPPEPASDSSRTRS